MHDKIHFIAEHYASLLLFCIAFWGLGSAVVAACSRTPLPDPWLHHALSLTLGMGLATMACVWMAAAGSLRRGNINVLLAVGCLLAVWQCVRACRDRTVGARARMPWQTWFYALLPLLLAIPSLTEILRPPYRGDELMYQLPHARQWAATGSLSVNEWLRYPWAAHSQAVLYAAGYIVRGEVFPHLLHSLAGWLTAFMVFRCALPLYGMLAASLASSAWLVLTRQQYDSAYVDMAVSVFVFASCVSCLRWIDRREDRGWLIVSGLLLGCAAAAKYHALGFVPFFVAAIVLSSRSWVHTVQWLAAAALPCCYWYVRNAWMTGDPFNPLGGRVFGFSDWDAGDLAYQMLDLKWNANWPAWYLWPAALMLFLPATWKTTAGRFLASFGAFGFAVWWATSHYDRYLMPSYPVLAILSAGAFVTVGSLVFKPGTRMTRAVHGAVLVALAAWQWPHTLYNVRSGWHDVALQPAEHERFLRENVRSYALAKALEGKALGKVYKFGLDSGVYYFANPVYGDHFGPWRYRDVGLDDRSAGDIATKFVAGGFTTLLLERNLVKILEAKPDFSQHFAEIAQADGDKAYAIRTTPHGPSR